MRLRLKHVALMLAVGFGALAIHAGRAFYASRKDGLPLSVRWEGAVIDYNFRDVARSLNACLGKELFAEELLMRSNGWFSGWSCSSVGNPEVIYSLNYAPDREELYFCRQESGSNLVGRFFNPEIELNDLEFIETWDDPRMVKAACGFFSDGLLNIAAGNRILVHCDAGRDRTGTYSAMLAALAAEHRGLLDESMLDALECDYRRTEGLNPSKFGRMKTFITNLEARGGVGKFLEERCGISYELQASASVRLLPPNGPKAPGEGEKR